VQWRGLEVEGELYSHLSCLPYVYQEHYFLQNIDSRTWERAVRILEWKRYKMLGWMVN
jgi:hypothetical protein